MQEINPNNERSRMRLWTAIEKSRRAMEPFIKREAETVRQYVGHNYSDDGSKEKVLLNLIELNTTILTRQLAARPPKALVTTPHRPLRVQAHERGILLNQETERMRLGETLRMLVKSAIMAPFGIVRTGMCDYGSAPMSDGFLHKVGRPFANNILFKNFVFDMSATRYEQVAFAGDRMRMPLEEVRNEKLFDKKVRESLQSTSKYDGGMRDLEDLEEISRGVASDMDEYMDYVELMPVWLPMEKKIVTITTDGRAKVLRTMDWEGPDGGPYHFLFFDEVPGQVMPLSPAAIMLGLHKLCNSVFSKTAFQAENYKEVFAFQGGSEDDAKRLLAAEHMATVQVNSIQGIQNFKFNTVDGPTLAFGLQLTQIFKEFMGNLDALGGLSPQADTASQDQMLSAAASKRVQDMQDRMKQFTKCLIKDIAWWMFDDPVHSYQGYKNGPAGSDMRIPFVMKPEDRQGTHDDYDWEIVPYSMQDLTPQQRLQGMLTLIQQVLTVFPNEMRDQGLTVRVDKLLAMGSEALGMGDDFDGVLESLAQPQEEEQQREERSRMPANTNRTTTRINRPGSTSGQKSNAMMQMLMGNKVQPAEANAVLRPTG